MAFQTTPIPVLTTAAFIFLSIMVQHIRLMEHRISNKYAISKLKMLQICNRLMFLRDFFTERLKQSRQHTARQDH